MDVMSARSATVNSAKYSWGGRGGSASFARGAEGRTDVALDGLVVVVHGLELERAVGAVDLVDKLGDLGRERGRVAGARRGDLDEHDLVLPLRVVVQEALERAQLFVDMIQWEVRA